MGCPKRKRVSLVLGQAIPCKRAVRDKDTVQDIQSSLRFRGFIRVNGNIKYSVTFPGTCSHVLPIAQESVSAYIAGIVDGIRIDCTDPGTVWQARSGRQAVSGDILVSGMGRIWISCLVSVLPADS